MAIGQRLVVGVGFRVPVVTLSGEHGMDRSGSLLPAGTKWRCDRPHDHWSTWAMTRRVQRLLLTVVIAQKNVI